MSTQQSQKRGLKSEDQKMERARDGYEPIPPAQPVAGAFGEHDSNTSTDEDVASRKVSSNPRQNNENE